MTVASGGESPPPEDSSDADTSPGHDGPGSASAAPSHAAWFAARRAAAAAPADEFLQSTTGLSPHVASVLCYAAAWLSAVIILMIERDSRLVRFHALQATIAFGFLCLLGMLCGVLTVVSAFYSTAAFKFFSVASEASWLAMAVLWVVALVSVVRNANWQMPLVGRFAQRLA